MIDHVLERYHGVISQFVVVVSPGASASFERHFRTTDASVACVIQEAPTGMLPAIRCAASIVRDQQPEQVWITWCDQIGISSATVRRLTNALDDDPDAAFVFPTVRQSPPYIHFIRDATNRIVGVLHRRDGDEMPPSGESDAGLFAMRRSVYADDLAEYDRAMPSTNPGHERHFLPFIPWLAGRASVESFEIADQQEAVGVNTPDDLRAVEAYLRERV